jgi:hypothetical protein
MMTNLIAATSDMQIMYLLFIPLFLVGAFSLIAILAGHIRKYVCYRHELEFKRDLVERGLSIDEIERVVAAKSSPDAK